MNSTRFAQLKKMNGVRNEGGFSTVALILVIVFFLVLPAALFAFETARAGLVQMELQNCTDAAALGGTAYLAGGASVDANTNNAVNNTQNHYATMNSAYQFFCQNQLMDVALIYPSGLPNGTLGLWSNTSNTPGAVAAQCYPNANPGAPAHLHTANLYYTLLDQSNNPQTLTSSTAVSLEVSSYWLERTIVAGYFLPIMQSYAMSAVSFGGLPQLDLVLCFDVSGSMDDGTNVALVDKYYDPNNGTPRIVYSLVPGTGITTITPQTSTGGGCTPTASDALFQLMNCVNDNPIAGTLANASQPQCLSVLQSGGAHAFFFQNGLRALNPALNGTTGAGANGGVTAEAGLPPGNYNSATPTLAYYPYAPTRVLLPCTGSLNAVPNPGATGGPGAYDFTDMVVLLPSITVAAPGTNPGTFNFAGASLNQAVANCVEASRGNLEKTTLLSSATCGVTKFYTYSSGTYNTVTKPTVQLGSYAAYWYGVRSYAFPMSAAITAASNFIQTMNLSSNLHISLLAFAGLIDSADGNAGIWTGDSYGGGTGSSNNNVDFNVPGFATNYIYGGINGTPSAQTPSLVSSSQLAGFPLPCMPLNATGTNSVQVAEAALTGNTTGTIDPLGQCLVATGGTDMGDAITEAFSLLSPAAGGSRTTAKQAIVLFSDGIPSAGSPDPIAATSTGHAAYPNIPVYTIGLSLAQSGSPFNTTQGQILGDGVTADCNGNKSGQGIAYQTASLGSKAFFVPANNTPAQTELALNTAFEQISKSLVILQQN